jgi:nitrile hydratase accessory protein
VTSSEPAIAAMGGAVALPRKNGEIVFSAPWQSRAFGAAVALQKQLGFPWMEFQKRLIAAVAAAPAREDEDPTDAYYRQWLDALESLVTERGLLAADELARRREQITTGEFEVV